MFRDRLGRAAKVAIALELALGLVRFLVLAVPLFLALWIGPYDEPSAQTIATWAGGIGALALPPAALVAFLGLPGGGLLTRFELGARRPSERERLAVDDHSLSSRARWRDPDGCP